MEQLSVSAVASADFILYVTLHDDYICDTFNSSTFSTSFKNCSACVVTFSCIFRARYYMQI